ncbi:MAG: hypothetical protein JKX99_08615 [Robiginitomaculum sp.]|nr:hypothetical protein [Robiginitomaculum sp.]
MKNLLLIFLFLCLPLLVSCTGFSPVYATNSPSRTAFSQISMPPITGANGFLFAQEMHDRAGIQTGSSGEYRLDVRLTPRRLGFATRVDNVITRFEVQIDALWTLTDAKGVVLTKMTTTSSSVFDSPDSPYASQVAEQDAEARALAVLADNIINQLNFYFAAAADK